MSIHWRLFFLRFMQPVGEDHRFSKVSFSFLPWKYHISIPCKRICLINHWLVNFEWRSKSHHLQDLLPKSEEFFSSKRKTIRYNLRQTQYLIKHLNLYFQQIDHYEGFESHVDVSGNVCNNNGPYFLQNICRGVPSIRPYVH